MRDEYALETLERTRKEEEERQAFRATVLAHAQQLVSRSAAGRVSGHGVVRW